MRLAVRTAFGKFDGRLDGHGVRGVDEHCGSDADADRVWDILMLLLTVLVMMIVPDCRCGSHAAKPEGLRGF